MLRTVALTTAALALAACGQKAETAKGADEASTTASATAPTVPSGPPARKPGLWVQTISTGDMTQTTRICLDEATDKAMSLVGSQMSDDICSKHEVTPVAGGYRFSSVCAAGDGTGTTTTEGTATGDFNARYKVEAQSTISGANAPQMNGARKMTVEAEWQGPCPAGFKPGDMELPGGMKMNIAALAGAAKGAR
jgi:hypothetical protein